MYKFVGSKQDDISTRNEQKKKQNADQARYRRRLGLESPRTAQRHRPPITGPNADIMATASPVRYKSY